MEIRCLSNTSNVMISSGKVAKLSLSRGRDFLIVPNRINPGAGFLKKEGPSASSRLCMEGWKRQAQYSKPLFNFCSRSLKVSNG